MKTKILIVDDVESCLGICSKILTSNGLDFILARSGIEALDTLRRYSHLIKSILMDINMKGLDGVKASIIIKRKFPHINIIAVTGDSSKKYMNENDQIQFFDGFVEKPFTSDGLISAIEIAESNRNELSTLLDEIFYNEIFPTFKRNYKRFSPPELTLASVFTEDGYFNHILNILDISRSGMALSSDEDLNEISKNQVFNLVFILSENYSTPCSVKAAVRYVSNHKIGLEYTHFDEDSGSMINDQ
jgi:CheY-like chemotaxis protein